MIPLLRLLHLYPANTYARQVVQSALFLHITVCGGAVLLALQTRYRLNLHSIAWPFYSFLGWATFFSYNLHFLLAARVHQNTCQLKWFAYYQKPITVALIISALLLSAMWFPYIAYSWILVVLMVLNGLYTLPLIVPVRTALLPFITFLKPYYIGACWSLVTVALPVYISDARFNERTVLELMYTFVLVTLATMLFDWRDRRSDRRSGIHTAANLFTAKRFPVFFLCHLAVFLLISLSLASPMGITALSSQLCLCWGIYLLLQKALQNPSEPFYLLWVDGLLVAAPVLTVMFF